MSGLYDLKAYLEKTRDNVEGDEDQWDIHDVRDFIREAIAIAGEAEPDFVLSREDAVLVLEELRMRPAVYERTGAVARAGRIRALAARLDASS